MSLTLLIEQREKNRTLALMDGSTLLAYNTDNAAGIAAEQVYLAVVDRVMKGMDAAFVRLTGKSTGFLPLSELPEKNRDVKSGDTLLLQVKRPPVGEKAAYMTADISLAGKYIILLPCTRQVAVSSRIADTAVKQQLLALAQRICPPQMGVVLRSEAEGAGEQSIVDELKTHLETWEALTAARQKAHAPCLIQAQEDALQALVRDIKGQPLERAVTNIPNALPPLPCPVSEHSSPLQLYGVDEKLKKALRRKVWLPSGGYLVIDPCEAMTVIDVNSGKNTGKKDAEDSITRLNIEAATEIARLMRLRNLGGIIIIDFIDMQTSAHRKAVQEALQAALQFDPVKTVLHGFTALGLMEVTRKRVGQALQPLQEDIL